MHLRHHHTPIVALRLRTEQEASILDTYRLLEKIRRGKDQMRDPENELREILLNSETVHNFVFQSTRRRFPKASGINQTLQKQKFLPQGKMTKNRA